MPKIKICGLTRPQDIEAVNRLVPDYIGFVFAKSIRMVDRKQAEKLRSGLDSRIEAVGVFVNSTIESIVSVVDACGLCVVQLHGDEDADFIWRLRVRLPEDCEIWKAMRVQTSADIRCADACGADRVVLDAFSAGMRGGTGRKFDWDMLTQAGISSPFLLAGGINAANVGQAISCARPFGIDVSSGVETDGLKDPIKMKRLIDAARSAEYQIEGD